MERWSTDHTERWTVLYRGVTADCWSAGSWEIKSNLVNGSLYLILDITDWPINEVLWMKLFYSSEINGQHSRRRQSLLIWVCEDERSLRGCVLVGWEVQPGGLEYRVEIGRAQQLGTTSWWENKNSLDIPTSLPPHQPPALSCSCRSWCHHRWRHTNLPTEEVKNTIDCCPCWRLAMFRVISRVLLNLKGSK